MPNRVERAWILGLRRLGAVAARPTRAALLTGAVGFLGAAGIGLLKGPPVPRVHDEFAYLLQAETFAKGRLTNPTHPMWRHFETLHVIHQPTYTAKYPPGQGAALALGEVVGRPELALWLTVGLMCGALTWMLIGWVPARWGLLVGLLATLKLAFFSYWAQEYWGGALAALGGALAFGALARILHGPSRHQGWLLGLGLAILALSRPLEGLLVTVPIGLALVWHVFVGRRQGVALTVLHGMAVLLPALATQALINLHSTGDPFVMPYTVHEETYSVAPTFPWQAERALPAYTNEELREFHVDYSLAFYRYLRTPAGFVELAKHKISRWVGFYLGPLILFVVAVPWALRDRRMLLLGLAAAPVFALSLFTNRGWPHYTAPAACLVYALVAGAAYHGYRHSGWPNRLRRYFLASLILFLGAEFAIRGTLFLADELEPHQADRRRIVRALNNREGPDLVVVRYLPEHRSRYGRNHEFVYNAADIDGAGIVWARELDDAANRRLLDYFSDRCIWLFEVGDAVDLRPHPDDPGSCPTENHRPGEG